MTIDIEVKGDPTALRTTASWLGTAGGTVHTAGTQVYGARADSTAGWHGRAADGFRGAMTHIGGKIDQLTGKMTATGAALTAHAASLDTVRSRMTMARQVAVDGGLTVTATAIMPPGPAPAAPGTLKPNATAAERTAHANATAAQNAYVSQVRAYQQAGQIVTGARTTETTSQRNLLGSLSSQFDWTMALDTGGSVIAFGIERGSKFRVDERHLANLATRAARLSTSTHLSSAQRLDAVAKFAKYSVAAQEARAATENNLLHRFSARLPQWAKTGLTFTAGGRAPAPTAGGLRPSGPAPANTALKVAKYATKIGGKVPVVGVAITAVGVGVDIANGEDPTKAVVSGAAGLVGGIAAGAAIGAIGGPVGALIGGIVGGVLASGAVDYFWQ
ncbi:MAG TPA: WXG100 family type VII secretion target [Actinoallomurus sp.]|jgi:uncharacterized protein YukE